MRTRSARLLPMLKMCFLSVVTRPQHAYLANLAGKKGAWAERIFPISLTVDVRFDRAPRMTRNWGRGWFFLCKKKE